MRLPEAVDYLAIGPIISYNLPNQYTRLVEALAREGVPWAEEERRVLRARWERREGVGHDL